MLPSLRILAPLLALPLPAVAAGAASSPLAEEPSAYLRSFADSPVRWMTWGDAALARAREEKKPIYLHIGSFTSELGRAMRDQSFAREENAAMVNENFVPILVDRDDRPDLAAFAQAYLNNVKQTQGAPYNVWLTPDLKPFDGASYLPPSDEWGKEGFTNATKRVIAAWQSDPPSLQRKGEEALAQLAAPPASADAPLFIADEIKTLLDESATAWRSTFDSTHGGFGEAPKHPDPELLRFLLQQEDEASREAALTTLRKIAASAVRDPLDGGFFRYATDTEWRLPYFQKTLADQARLALAYLDAAKVSGDELLADAAADALRYALTLGNPQSGYAAADDGTLETIVPSFLWSEKDVRGVLNGTEADAFLRVSGVTAAGNIAPDAYLGIDATGKSVLQRSVMPATEADAKQFAASSAKLLEVRRQRPAPLRDAVAPSGAHGLLLTALARAGAETKDAELTAAAGGVASYIRAKLLTPAGGLRTRAGRDTSASPRDYALVIDGLLTLHAVAPGTSSDAKQLAETLLQQLQSTYADGATGRIYAIGTDLGHIPVRVLAPAPEGRDLPGAKAALLLALTSHDTGDSTWRGALAAQIAADINDSPNQPRGDQLLALHSILSGKR